MHSSRWLVLGSVLQCSACMQVPAGKSAANVQRLNQGVFQVVVPRVEDDGITYKEPLPYDLLPFDQRHDKFVGVGTAFAISPWRFVTAAHLFAAPFGTLIQHYYVRNSTGVPHEIGSITKYSQYRDLVEFTLLDAPTNVVPLEVRGNPMIGEPVRTVGNALGEGVVLRDGLLTSLTPEPAEGRWKFLRFSAPASPGNSGGPLVDAQGRVLGVVVRKSGAENLNFAVPIDELDKLSSEKSEFWIKSLPYIKDGKHMNFGWRFASPLPASLDVLRTASMESFKKALIGARSDFEAKFSKELFPNHPNLEACIREPNLGFGFGAYVVDGNGKWTIANSKYSEQELAPGQFARIHLEENKVNGELLLDRPKGMPLLKFFESPKILADTIVHSLSWTLTFAGRKIGIESLGEPTAKQRWVDDYGRPWFTFTWPLKRSDSVFVLNCTPNPGGWACGWKRVPVAISDALQMGFQEGVSRIAFAYYGHLKDWQEFSQLPDAYKPAILAKSSVNFDKELKFKVGPFSGNVKVPLLSENSALLVFVGVDPMNRRKERIAEIQLTPRKDKGYSFTLWRVMEPAANSSESYTQLWKTIQDASAPFHNTAVIDGNKQIIRKVSRLKRQSPLGDIYVHVCKAGTEDSKDELTAACQRFQESTTTEDE